ncbi:Phosphoprotein phosphatase [Bertholletia excelsa]
MAKNDAISVKDAVHKLQLYLLEGIKNEDQLFAAGSLISKGDYQDVVTERSIVQMCGYPLCSNPLPAERSRKGRYRISLKEHKVYDLNETYMYCSTSCVVNSRAFAGSLREERCSFLNTAKFNEIMQLFEGFGLKSEEHLERDGDLGFSKLKIQEKTDTKTGEVSLEEWIGPSNAIEGYVPQRDQNSKPLQSKNCKEGSKPTKLNKGKNVIFNEMDFKSAIITQDEYNISKLSMHSDVSVADAKSKGSIGKSRHENTENQCTFLEQSPGPVQTDLKGKLKEAEGAKKKQESHAIKGEELGATIPKSSLKSAGAKKQSRSVTWADERTDGAENGKLCDIKKLGSTEGADQFRFPDRGDDDNSVRFASAEACAIALSQASEAVACGGNDVSDAVSEAGIIILPPPHNVDEEESQENISMPEPEPIPTKWPRKPGVPNYNLFDSEDSWYDSPPDGFSLTLSTFATMWMALFTWISSSSLAYVYGHDDSFHEDYLSVNGREYPQKILLTDGRSSEIKQTLAGCLARALPGLVADLRLPTPISTLEQGMACLLDTMSFIDPLPPFRMKQWQVIALLFIDALSVSRIPGLTPYIISRRAMLHKVLDGAQISLEEYETMRELMIPLGRVPEFSAQSGG